MMNMTREYLEKIFKLLIFWILLFNVQRALFLIYTFLYGLNSGIGISDIVKAFPHAFTLDLSTACYFMVLPSILFYIQGSWPVFRAYRIIRVYSIILLIIVLLVSLGEVGIYREWNSKLSYKALVYLKNPIEVIRSAKTSELILIILVFAVELFVFGKFLGVVLQSQKAEKVEKAQRGFLNSSLLFITTIFFLFIGIRGGFGQIPISLSDGYFSRHQLLNQAAVNPVYNIVYSILNYSEIDNSSQFHFMADAEAKRIVKDLHSVRSDSTLRVLRCDKPNVMIIFLESWSGDMIESLGGRPGLTPEFHKLEKEGILFTELYASGNRSQQALANVFSGLPSLPFTTFTNHPEKYRSAHSLVHILNSEGYKSTFYFGGDLNYGNIKSFLLFNEFDEFVDEDGFEEDVERGKLGVHDEFLFDRILSDMEDQSQPFFTVALTLSSHSPYDQPGERPFTDYGSSDEYVNSVWYADKCLGNFIRKARTKNWYDSTLIVLMSDHSHPSYNGYKVWDFEYRRIPLLFLGGAVRSEYRGLVKDRIASNVDLTRTLLKQLNLGGDEFNWSKDLFNPFSPQFAFFETDDGFGWKCIDGQLVYHVKAHEVISIQSKGGMYPKLKREGQAYLQVLIQDFLTY